MKLDTLKKLYIDQIKDLHNAEKQLLNALPQVVGAATNPNLKKALESHLKETQTHVERLEKICKDTDFEPTGEKCEAMSGLIQEAKGILGEDSDPRVLDAALICAAQKIEHYEIGSYGCLRAYARLLGDNAAAQAIEKTLKEEQAADANLTELAEQSINQLAMAAS